MHVQLVCERNVRCKCFKLSLDHTEYEADKCLEKYFQLWT